MGNLVFFALFNELVVLESFFQAQPCEKDDENKHSDDRYIVGLGYDFEKIMPTAWFFHKQLHRLSRYLKILEKFLEVNAPKRPHRGLLLRAVTPSFTDTSRSCVACHQWQTDKRPTLAVNAARCLFGQAPFSLGKTGNEFSKPFLRALQDSRAVTGQENIEVENQKFAHAPA